MKKKELIQQVYDIAIDPATDVNHRINIVKALEEELNTEFDNGADFRYKMERYLNDEKVLSVGQEIKEVRKKIKLSSRALARQLKISHVFILNVENGNRKPTKQLIDWLEDNRICLNT